MLYDKKNEFEGDNYHLSIDNYSHVWDETSEFLTNKKFAHFERPDSSSQDVGREHICVHVYTKILGIQVRKGGENNYNFSIYEILKNNNFSNSDSKMHDLLNLGFHSLTACTMKFIFYQLAVCLHF